MRPADILRAPAHVLNAQRHRLPGWAATLVDRVVRALPERVAVALGPASARFAAVDIPTPPPAPTTPVRLYIAPANFAGQGYAWARAIERELPGVEAIDMAFFRPQDFAFRTDDAVPVAVYALSRTWQRRQLAYVEGFTHVVIEAQRALFGQLFDSSPFAEARHLTERGIAVAMLCHGSDIRLPSRHREVTEWSPFGETEPELTAQLEASAAANARGLDELGAPVFVSTPDLLLDVPRATWVPVVVDPARWASDVVPLERKVPVVVHSPSHQVIKGTALIEPVLEDFERRGLLEYRRLEGVAAERMPALFASADIVLDQFRLGSYGVAACEAMASGRLVIGHVTEQVRGHVLAASGLAPAILEATPGSLASVLESVLDEREHFAERALAGPEFVARVHDGAAAAAAFAPFLGVAQR